MKKTMLKLKLKTTRPALEFFRERVDKCRSINQEPHWYALHADLRKQGFSHGQMTMISHNVAGRIRDAYQHYIMKGKPIDIISLRDAINMMTHEQYLGLIDLAIGLPKEQCNDRNIGTPTI